MEKYIGITIGPIIKTLAKAKHTRELWAASYFFSNTMKVILDEIKKTHSNEIILPNTQNIVGLNLYGAGLFPDRIIYKVKELGDFENACKIIKEAKKYMANQIDNGGNIQYSKTEIEDYLNDYLKIYACEIEVTKNSIIEVNNSLDALELQDNMLQKDTRKSVHSVAGEPKSLSPFENYLDSANMGIAALDEFENNPINQGHYDYLKGKFPTVLDIAMIELLKEHLDIKDILYENYSKKGEPLIEKVKGNLNNKKKQLIEAHKPLDNFKNIKFRNKYICIVHADGDNIGKTIKALSSPTAINTFSKALFDFSINSTKTISDFGGKPIYVGGDDLLFLCPVVGVNDKTFLSLLNDLDQHFLTAMNGVPETKQVDKKPSLSFGVSITYYKFPLYEALEISRKQLFTEVKYKLDNYGKNAIAIKLQKHSGQTFNFKVSKPSSNINLKTQHTFESLATTYLGKPQMLNTMIFKLDEAKILLQSALTDVDTHINYATRKEDEKKNRLDGFFENFFNEPVHKKPKNLQYIQNIKQLLIDIYFDHQQIFKNTDGVLNQFYNALRIIHFIQQEDSND